MRPDFRGMSVTTPSAAITATVFGARVFGSLALTVDEFRAIQKLYRFVPEGSHEKPEAPVAPLRSDFDADWKYRDAEEKHKRAMLAWDLWEDPRGLLQAGADRNAIRHAESDGLRIIAWLAKYVPTGEDPLKHVIQFASQAGLDVDTSDLDWADRSDDD